MVTFLLLLLLLKALSGVRNGGRYPFPSQLEAWGSVVSSPAGSGAEPQPKTILVLSRGTRMAVVAILVAHFVFFSQAQGLRLNHITNLHVGLDFSALPHVVRTHVIR